ncbi:MAG: ChrR family anti-sigma-E factor [Rhodobacteraceae bacterium]|nr:ChrR family anti-sigma-E factor [Paracoccaceae bacterium]
MGRINHHLTDPLLIAYAAGTLPEAFSLVAATHVSLCDECRARLAAFEAVGGAVVETAEAVPVAEGSLAATLARIAAGPKAEIRTPPKAAGILPAPLAAYVGGDLSAVRWRSVGGGVRQAILPTSRGASVRLLHIPAGAAVPDHGHRGTELTLVLQGAFRDDADRFARGDVEVADASVEHTPVAEPGEDCICLAATDAPLRFNALLPRLAQPFLRI